MNQLYKIKLLIMTSTKNVFKGNRMFIIVNCFDCEKHYDIDTINQ